MTARTVLTVAGLTLREAARRRVLRALGALTFALLTLSAWGFSKLAGIEFEGSALTSGEERLLASQVLNLVMFGISLIAALGTAFLAGPTLAGEIESGTALSILARPVRRSAVLLGKWLGLVAFGSGFVAVAGLAQFLVVRATVGYWPPQPVEGLALLAAQTAVLLTLGLLLATLISPMASGVVAVGLFGATWIAGVVGRHRRRARQRGRRAYRHRVPHAAADGRPLARRHARTPGSDRGRAVRRPRGRGRVPLPEQGALDRHVPRLGRPLGDPPLRARRGDVPAPRPVSRCVSLRFGW